MSYAVQRLLVTDPLTVTASVDDLTGEARAKILIGDTADPNLAGKFARWPTTLPVRSVVRIGGGCSGLDNDVRIELAEYLVAGFAGYRGLLFSGATRDVSDDGTTTPMITDAAVAVHLANP